MKRLRSLSLILALVGLASCTNFSAKTGSRGPASFEAATLENAAKKMNAVQIMSMTKAFVANPSPIAKTIAQMARTMGKSSNEVVIALNTLHTTKVIQGAFGRIGLQYKAATARPFSPENLKANAAYVAAALGAISQDRNAAKGLYKEVTGKAANRGNIIAIQSIAFSQAASYTSKGAQVAETTGPITAGDASFIEDYVANIRKNYEGKELMTGKELESTITKIRQAFYALSLNGVKPPVKETFCNKTVGEGILQNMAAIYERMSEKVLSADALKVMSEYISKNSELSSLVSTKMANTNLNRETATAAVFRDLAFVTAHKEVLNRETMTDAVNDLVQLYENCEYTADDVAKGLKLFI